MQRHRAIIRDSLLKGVAVVEIYTKSVLHIPLFVKKTSGSQHDPTRATVTSFCSSATRLYFEKCIIVLFSCLSCLEIFSFCIFRSYTEAMWHSLIEVGAL